MLVFAHRGASGHQPENTLIAIRHALDVKVDAIEIDVHVNNETLVVIHDRWLHKTTNGKGKVDQLSFTELRQLDAGDGHFIPTLEEALAEINGQCMVNIELKADNSVELLLAIIDKAIRTFNFTQDQFLISSFNHPLLHQVKSLRNDLKIGALTASCPLDYAVFGEELDAYSVNIDVNFVNEAFVKDAHQRNLKVYVYTVDQEEDIIAMHRLGVDGIFSNYPSKSSVKIAHLKSMKYA